MPTQTFQLKKGQPYIQLNNLLQICQLAQTGGHAKILIQQKEVLVNGEIETRVRKKLMTSDEVKIGDHLIQIE